MSRIAVQSPPASTVSKAVPAPPKAVVTSTPPDLVNPAEILIESRKVSVFYGSHEAIRSASLCMPKNRVIAMIGPSGCGKSTFLRSINRLNDLIPGCRVEGQLLIERHNIYDSKVDLVALRRRVGLVFQKPNPFPKSIYDNIAYGPRLQGIRNRRVLDELVEDCL